MNFGLKITCFCRITQHWTMAMADRFLSLIGYSCCQSINVIHYVFSSELHFAVRRSKLLDKCISHSATLWLLSWLIRGFLSVSVRIHCLLQTPRGTKDYSTLPWLEPVVIVGKKERQKDPTKWKSAHDKYQIWLYYNIITFFYHSIALLPTLNWNHIEHKL